MKKDTMSFSFRPSAEAPQSDVGNQKWRLGSKLGVYGEAAGKAKQQAASSLVTVYLLTGPMLLGIPAREEQREKHVTAAWRLCWLTSGLLFYWKLVESGHMAAPWHPQMLLVGCMFSFTVRCCLGSERCKKHLRTSWEQKQCFLLLRQRQMTETCSSKLPKVAMRCFWTDLWCMQAVTQRSNQRTSEMGDMSYPAPVCTSLHHSISFARQPQRR